VKKLFLVAMLLCFCVSVSSAEVYISARQAAMGGTGVAGANGLDAVAYNPAGLLKGPDNEFRLSYGFATKNFDQIYNSFSSANDPGSYMVDNYDTNLDANGNISGILGADIRHVGISLLTPSIKSVLSKPAGTLVGSFNNIGTSAIVLTLGRSFLLPVVNIASLDIGVNLKSFHAAQGTITIASDPTITSSSSATATYWTGSGFGVDLGARTNITIPALADFSVGVALKNLAQTITYNPKTRVDTFTLVGGSPVISKGSEVVGTSTTTSSPVITSIGCAGTIPITGIKLAADIESIGGGSGALAVPSETVTHLGLEWPIMMKSLLLRAGFASGSNTSLLSFGAQLNLPFMGLEITNVIDQKNSENTSWVLDASIGI